MQRHYGLDWLRIGAFALLILYHIGMFFVPWDWHVKTATPQHWVAIPMLATNAWRLMLLFVVAGYASRALIGKLPPARFARERTARLMLPVVFAAVFLIAPQPWVELMVKHDYPHDYLRFWSHDYFRFGVLDGLVLPTWQHLWFVVYLWVYTLLLAGFAAWTGRSWQSRFDRAFAGIGLIAIPLGWLLLARLVLAPAISETHDLFSDRAAHLVYLPAFLFGFALAGSPSVWQTIRRVWPAAAMLAAVGFGGVLVVEFHYPGNAVPTAPWLTGLRIARVVQAWGTIVALLGIADRFWNHDHPWRATLTEAVFPFYIIHQSIIVVVGWWLLRFNLSASAEIAVLLPVTIVGCWAFYGVGSRIGGLRRWIGLKPVARAAKGARASAGG